MAAAVLSTGCSGLLGLDEFGAASSQAGTTGTSSSGDASSATSSSATTGGAAPSGSGGEGAGGGASGQGGAGGGGEPCDDEGAVEPCYEGDPETVDRGTCRKGERTCVDGRWSACEGQVLPREEDLTTWADESCSAGDLEVRTFVRYAGTNDDYIGGAGWLGEPAGDEDAIVAVGTYGELTIGSVTVSTDVDLGTALVRHRRDGSVVWVRGLSTAAPNGLATGHGFALLRGYAGSTEVIDGEVLDGDFVAVVDADGTFRDAISVASDTSIGGRIHGFVGAFGREGNTFRRYEVDFANGTVSASTILDFGSQEPGVLTRTVVGSNPYLVASGTLSGTFSHGGCTAQSATQDGFVAVFSGTTSPTCASIAKLGATGSSRITAMTAVEDRLYVSGYFSGSLVDETGAVTFSEGTSSAFVARMTITPGGAVSLAWLRAYGGSGLVTGSALLPAPSGGVVWSLLVPNDGRADVEGVSAGPGQTVVHFDASGDVRYSRFVGALTSASFRLSDDVVLAAGDLSDDAVPFGIDPPPPPGGMSDGFFALLTPP